MPKQPIFTIFCLIVGLVLGAFGTLLLMTQCSVWSG